MYLDSHNPLEARLVSQYPDSAPHHGWKMVFPGGGLAGGYELSRLSPSLKQKIVWPVLGTIFDLVQYGPATAAITYATKNQVDKSYVAVALLAGAAFLLGTCFKAILVQEEYFKKSDAYWKMVNELKNER